MTIINNRDQFGRPGSATPFALSVAVLISSISGSVWPPQARSLWPPFDTPLPTGKFRSWRLA